MRRSVSWAALWGATGMLVLAGCRGCRNEHPYVPYRIEAGASGSSAPLADAPSPLIDAGPLPPEPARAATPRATSWALGSLVLEAPPGTTFRFGLTWDLDGDGRDDALTLVERGGEHGDPLHEELYFYRGVAAGPTVPVRVDVGGAGALDGRCNRVERLTRVGRHSAAIELGQTCVKGSGASLRVIASVVWREGSLRVPVDLTVIDPPAAPTLGFDLDGADADGDGLDDITVHVSLAGGGAPFEPLPAVHATFRWYDRPAGMSRQPDEPEASFRAVAASAQQKATRSKDAASAAALAQAGLSLFQALCEESNARRVTSSPSAQRLLCEPGRAIEDLELARVRADVTLGDPLRAIGALDAAGKGPTPHTQARLTEATSWVTQLAPVAQATFVRAVGAVPRLGEGAASWGALRFEPSGMLLVRTLAGVVRVEPLQGDEAEATGVSSWGTSLESPDGKLHFVSATAPCHTGGLVARFANAAGQETTLDLPIPTPLSTTCQAGSVETAAVLPLAWGPGGFEAVVGGVPILVAPEATKASVETQSLGQVVTFGAPRSPDGRTLVVPTSLGILVRHEGSRLFRAKELEHGYGELRDCAVSDDGLRVACVRGGLAFVGGWPAP